MINKNMSTKYSCTNSGANKNKNEDRPACHKNIFGWKKVGDI